MKNLPTHPGLAMELTRGCVAKTPKSSMGGLTDVKWLSLTAGNTIPPRSPAPTQPPPGPFPVPHVVTAINTAQLRSIYVAHVQKSRSWVVLGWTTGGRWGRGSHPIFSTGAYTGRLCKSYAAQGCSSPVIKMLFEIKCPQRNITAKIFVTNY